MALALQDFCPRGSPGRNTGVGCHALLQGIFLRPRDQTHVSDVSCIDRWFFAFSAQCPVPGKPSDIILTHIAFLRKLDR